LGIDLIRCLSDNVAVEERQRLAQCDGDNDEGNEQKGVDTGHHEKAKIGLRPVESDRDGDVEGCNASL